MWGKFDQFAHDAYALWRRCREGVGKNEAGGIVWKVDHAALRAYIEAGGPLVDDHEDHEILDGVLIVNATKTGG